MNERHEYWRATDVVILAYTFAANVRMEFLSSACNANMCSHALSYERVCTESAFCIHSKSINLCLNGLSFPIIPLLYYYDDDDGRRTANTQWVVCAKWCTCGSVWKLKTWCTLHGLSLCTQRIFLMFGGRWAMSMFRCCRCRCRIVLLS